MWEPLPSDVFIVTDNAKHDWRFVLSALIEEPTQAWKPQPFFVSRMGAENYLQAISGWSGRRAFRALGHPEDFPCHLPFKQTASGTPKVVVLVRDPRRSIAEIWKYLQAYMTYSFAEFLNLFCHGEVCRLPHVSKLFESSLAWARLA